MRQIIAFFITLAIHLWVNRERIRNSISSLFVYTYEPDVPEIVNTEPWVNPLFDCVDELVSMSARELRQFTGINRKCSKYHLASHYLCLA